MVETMDGVRYFWISGPSYEGNGLGRIRNMMSFLSGLKKYQVEICAHGKPDVVIASSYLLLWTFIRPKSWRNVTMLC